MVLHFMDICGNDCVGHLSRKSEPAGGLFSTTRRGLVWIFFVREVCLPGLFLWCYSSASIKGANPQSAIQSSHSLVQS